MTPLGVALSGSVPAAAPVVLASILFAIGAAGVLLRRNAIIVFACIEMMMNAANLLLVAMADAWDGPEGRVFVFFVIVVAAAEAAVGLGIVIALHRLHGSIDVDRASLMRG
jgi:NADH-quinone oxidoreductase subunit K